MSNALAIAASLAVLRQQLQAGLAALKIGDVLGGTLPAVSCLAPDQIDTKGTQSQLNLFLVHHSRNTGWSNRELPARDPRGERVASPPLALDLQVLVTAYGVASFQAEVLLGAAMQVLHETPVLGREAIRAALLPAPSQPDLPKELALAGLADQIEQLRITPLNQSIDESVRLWSAIQLPMRQSAAYQLGVLLINAPRSQRVPLPVRQRAIYLQPLRQPRLDRIEALPERDAPVLPATLLRLAGAQLAAPALRLMVNGIDLSAAIDARDDESIVFGLQVASGGGPPAPPAGLRAGVCVVQVLHPRRMGSPPTEHGAVESNPVAFVLNPVASFTVAAGATSQTVDGVAYKSGTVDVSCSPRVGPRQRVRLLLNEKAPPAGRAARAYSFDLADGNGVTAPATDTAALAITYRSVAAGSYLARLQVDAGISPLEFEDDELALPEVIP